MQTNPVCQERAAAPECCCGCGGVHEVASFGLAPELCGVPPSMSATVPLGDGLRVPSLKTSTLAGSATTAGRYQFTLAVVKLPTNGAPVRLVGLGQLLTVWVDTANGASAQTTPTTLPVAPIEAQVGTPTGNPLWHPPDGNVSWHLRKVRSWQQSNSHVLTSNSFAWRWSDSPALIFESAVFPAANKNGQGTPDNYLTLTGYQPPGGGQIDGEDVGGLGTFYGIRFPWFPEPLARPIEVCGPGALVFSACVWQTDNTAGNRSTLTLPASFGFPAGTQTPEDAFAYAFPNYIYGRVGGRLVVEYT